jgi:hypothetical protein
MFGPRAALMSFADAVTAAVAPHRLSPNYAKLYKEEDR